MTEYVEKSIIFPTLNKAMSENGSLGMADVEDIIDDLPTADVQPVRRGKWETCYICSNCHEFADYFASGDVWFDKMPSYCPNCGADMRGEDNAKG